MGTPIKVNSYLVRGPRVDPATLVGVKYILNLETSQGLIGDHSPLNEAMAADKVGIRVYGHPLGGILPPTVKELRDAVWFIVDKPDTVYVHCEHGHERTGMVIAAYRVLVERWTPYAAAKEALALGLHWVFIPWLIQLWRLW